MQWHAAECNGALQWQERQRIATGLADGFSYAEIARRLERPTSTISREVSRNGGPGRYRPQQAHQATVERARRGAPAHPARTGRRAAPRRRRSSSWR
ncbi:helix-turn-helix domain-containing protein [Streptomyces sp. NPDC012769]|uniref:helix-turn-helix domain-containing protein n=1 Tax=Streptomyces sp. NPDC012769 TaxID=3364848 RepID=UPI00368E6D87